jgi:hypothetical protein
MILFDKKFGYLKSRRIFEASQREIIITTKQNTKIMKSLTENQINKMTQTERQNELDRLQDLLCNIDYTTKKGELSYNIHATSAERIINKQNGEF